jgi:hypothetical protein
MTHLLYLARRAVATAASGSILAVGAKAWCEVQPNEVDDVKFTERPQQQWIEVSQRRLADSFSDWSSLDYESAVRSLRSAYRMPMGVMDSLKSHLVSEASLALAGAPSSMRMLPTYVNSRVTGAEKGDFYALDLGGTNFRVLRLTLEGDGQVGPVKQAKFHVPDEIKKGTGKELFGFLADSVATFLATECGGNPSGELGFVRSRKTHPATHLNQPARLPRHTRINPSLVRTHLGCCDRRHSPSRPSRVQSTRASSSHGTKTSLRPVW